MESTIAEIARVARARKSPDDVVTHWVEISELARAEKAVLKAEAAARRAIIAEERAKAKFHALRAKYARQVTDFY